MRAWAAGVVLLVLLAGLSWGAESGSATHLGYRPCRNTELRKVSVTKIQSNFGCRNARRALRTLLADGIRRLPKPTAAVGVWGCRYTGTGHFYSCERRRSGLQGAAGVVFAPRPRRAR